MKLYRIPAAVLAVLMLLTASGCAVGDFFFSRRELPESSAAERDPRRYDTEPLRKMAEQLQETKKLPDAKAQMQTEIQAMLDAVDQAYAVYIHANMDYYADWNNKDKSALSDAAYSDYYVADRIATWGFCNAMQNSDYRELLEPYVNADWAAYYIANNLNRVISRAKEEADENGALLDDYYSTAYDENVDAENPEKTNLACAQLYLNTLDTYDTEQYLYDYYNRDYTVEQASAMYHDLIEKLLPLYQTLHAYVVDDPRYELLKENGFAVEDPYAVLKQYAPKLSPQIAESVDLLFSGPYYIAAKGADSYDGSYTVTSPFEKTAWMYTHFAGDYYDLTTVIHEFGHFNSDRRDLTPIYLTQNCIDLAEVQSQGMEMLFTSLYDEIYGGDADYLEALELFNIMDSVISGFAVGEFEYEVMQQQDSVSPDEICDIYSEIKDTCGLKMDLYQISHLFEQPGYYISYGVSALAALQIYARMQEDYDAAVKMYTAVTEIGPNSGALQFSEGLKQCGFADIFTESALDEVSDVIERHMNAIMD